jgi:hypothetical protein
VVESPLCTDTTSSLSQRADGNNWHSKIWFVQLSL